MSKRYVIHRNLLWYDRQGEQSATVFIDVVIFLDGETLRIFKLNLSDLHIAAHGNRQLIDQLSRHDAAVDIPLIEGIVVRIWCYHSHLDAITARSRLRIELIVASYKATTEISYFVLIL